MPSVKTNVATRNTSNMVFSKSQSADLASMARLNRPQPQGPDTPPTRATASVKTNTAPKNKNNMVTSPFVDICSANDCRRTPALCVSYNETSIIGVAIKLQNDKMQKERPCELRLSYERVTDSNHPRPASEL